MTSHRTLLSPADGAAAALAAPTTEVFTGYGAEPGFEASVREFAARVDAERPAGYRGCAVGPVAEAVCGPTGGGEKSLAVKLVVGWDSKEAHLEAKGKPGGELIISRFLAYPFCPYFSSLRGGEQGATATEMGC